MGNALMLATLLALAPAIATTAPSGLPVVVVHAPSADLHLEVARTPADQERGLMNRTAIAPHTGMLFVFERDDAVEFWMKNTLVPLDMIFIGSDGAVRKIYANVPAPLPSLPDERIPREPGVAKYVIELGAGEAARDGITQGSRLVIPDLARA
ncbi:MAG TPA: DUF192 domain-containing protein [Candidatus Tumulicola sp.]|jgi:hypothetical protein